MHHRVLMGSGRSSGNRLYWCILRRGEMSFRRGLQPTSTAGFGAGQQVSGALVADARPLASLAAHGGCQLPWSASASWKSSSWTSTTRVPALRSSMAFSTLRP